ncbi:MAG: hypothetical protein ACUVT4_01465 [Actinomycetota bacterium]
MRAPDFETTDAESMATILEAVSFSDELRWKCEKDDRIDYFREDVSSETKSLNHFLNNVKNRQIPFRRIWVIG